VQGRAATGARVLDPLADFGIDVFGMVELAARADRQSTSTSARSAMYSTQSAPNATISSTSRVAITPVFARPHSSPASCPALASEYTYRPTSSNWGCSMTVRNDRRPMFPVAHCTTR
jgi:hypothetical protein